MEFEKKLLDIFQTRNYDQFKFTAGNRPIKQQAVKGLIESFTKHGWLSANPMMVNKKGEIIDGQQRFEAAKQMKIPVVFAIQGNVKLDATELIADLQIVWRWTASNYAEWFITRGNKDQNLHYNMYVKFKEQYRLPQKITLRLLCGRKHDKTTLAKNFTSGKFRVADYSRAEQMADKLQRIGEYYDGYKRSTFLDAMLKVMRNGNFNYKRFIDKLSYQKDKMVDLAKTMDYLRLIEEIYNFKCKENDIVRLF